MGWGVLFQEFHGCLVLVVRLFERGVAYVGTDYLSHLLWDKYLEFEHYRSEWSRIAQIYTRILQIPLSYSDKYLARLES